MRGGACSIIAGLLIASGDAEAGARWYLLAPPMYATGEKAGSVEADAPLSRWWNVAAYDSASGCEAAKAKTRKEAVKILEDRILNDFNRALWTAYLASQCTASDDPRLK